MLWFYNHIAYLAVNHEEVKIIQEYSIFAIKQCPHLRAKLWRLSALSFVDSQATQTRLVPNTLVIFSPNDVRAPDIFRKQKSLTSMSTLKDCCIFNVLCSRFTAFVKNSIFKDQFDLFNRCVLLYQALNYCNQKASVFCTHQFSKIDVVFHNDSNYNILFWIC